MRIIWIILGSLCVAAGSAGVVIPGLPATPFFLLAAYFYARSSNRLHRWLLNSPVIGRMIRDYQEHRGVTLRTKVVAIAMMTGVLTLSVLFLIPLLPVKIAVSLLGVIGLIVILKIRTIPREKAHGNPVEAGRSEIQSPEIQKGKGEVK
jgi:hypothetical protein